MTQSPTQATQLPEQKAPAVHGASGVQQTEAEKKAAADKAQPKPATAKS